jgi:GNAT superfamily N-acetyltransferase
MLCFERLPATATASRGTSGSLAGLFQSIAQLEAFYPHFRLWFWGKVAPGLATGSRQILAACSKDDLVGLAILKRELSERKICTLWVAPSGRNDGVGTRLVGQALAWLECEKPLITVCQERLDELQPLLRKFGFTLEQVCESYYRAARLEYVFNGLASQREDSLQSVHLSALDLKKGTPAALGLPARCIDF